jgi:PAS domain S-box-containing protein
LTTPYPRLEPDPIEDRLREEQERFSFALEAAGMVAWEWDAASGRGVRSRNASYLLGLPVSGTDEEFLALIHPEDRERVRQALARAVSEGEIYDEEFRIVRPDGSISWVADRGRMTRGSDGHPGSMAGVLRDITASRQVEEELRRSEERLQRSREHLQFVSDAAAVGVAHCDADWRFVFVNQTYAARLGLTADQIVGRTIPEVLGVEAAEAIRPHVERVLSGVPVRFEMEIAYPQIGRRYLLCTYTPEIDPNGRVAGWVAAITDLTDRHQLEETLRRSEESLKEADRRKDEFLATLAHELRNPLAPIRNAVQILRVQGPAEPDVQWAREVIDRQVQQLTHLVDDLLDVSRITRGKIELRKERIELAAILERALETSRPVVEAAHHRLTVTFPEGPVWVAADLTRMAQVLSNLINNAAKYTRAGGHIQVSASGAGRPQAVATIQVRDDGIGIQPEMLSHIFDMFAQVDTSLERAQGGLGIGLTIARSLVEMHGGTIEASSAGLGRGSVFDIRLPLAQELAQKEDVRAADREHEARGGLRVLVVDDNEDSADSLAIWLRLKGHEVRTAYDGPQALAQALEQPPELVLLDIGMPGMSGYEVARRLRAHPGTRLTMLVAMTGWGQEEDRRQSREAGIDQHLVKPLEPRVLEDLIARLAR